MECEAGKRDLVFYADERRIEGQDHKWEHHALTLTVAMFRSMGLKANL